jgi:activating signal cointegrator 1
VKALSLWQPWASLVILGAKRIETRGWSTLYRGPLVIHAASKVTNAQLLLHHEEPFKSALAEHGIRRWQDLPLGACLGIVELVDVVRIAGEYVPTSAGFSKYHEERELDEGMQPPDEPERSFGNYEAGRFAWMLARPRPLEKPVPRRARQRLFDVALEELGFEVRS